MILPKLPEGFFLDFGYAVSIRLPPTERQKEIGHSGEQVAFFYYPNRSDNDSHQYKCASCPKGVFERNNFHWAYADTEQEAIDLIVSFALLSITKE
jgi:hypothetical protein